MSHAMPGSSSTASTTTGRRGARSSSDAPFAMTTTLRFRSRVAPARSFVGGPVSRRFCSLVALVGASIALLAGPVAAQTDTTTTTVTTTTAPGTTIASATTTTPAGTTPPAPKTGDTSSANGVTRTILGVAEPQNAPGQTLLLQDI